MSRSDFVTILLRVGEVWLWEERTAEAAVTVDVCYLFCNKIYKSDPPENYHLTVKKLAKTLLFFFKLPKIVLSFFKIAIGNFF